MQDLRIMMFGFIGDEKQVEDIFQREPSPQLSAVKFQRAIVDGLVESGAAVSILSSMPIASYPTNKLVIHGHPFTLSGGRAHGRVMGFINLPVVKLFNRFLSALVYGTRMVRQQQVNMIFCYSLHTPFLLTAILLRKLTGIAVTVMINDLPMNMAGKPERGLRAIAKQLDNRLLNSLASRADLILPVAKGIIDDWVPSAKEYLVIDAIAPNDLAPLPAKAVGGRRTILYAGNLSHVINFATLFHHARDLDAQLVFVGGGPRKPPSSRLLPSIPESRSSRSCAAKSFSGSCSRPTSSSMHAVRPGKAGDMHFPISCSTTCHPAGPFCQRPCQAYHASISTASCASTTRHRTNSTNQ